MASREARVQFPATMPGLAQAGETLRAFLDGIELDPGRRYQLELTFDEIAGNVVRHGQPVTSVEVSIAIDEAEAVMTFDDDGVAFDPRTYQDRRPPEPVDRAQTGGLGLVLVKTAATGLDYQRTGHGHNRLTLTIPLRQVE